MKRENCTGATGEEIPAAFAVSRNGMDEEIVFFKSPWASSELIAIVIVIFNFTAAAAEAFGR